MKQVKEVHRLKKGTGIIFVAAICCVFMATRVYTLSKTELNVVFLLDTSISMAGDRIKRSVVYIWEVVKEYENAKFDLITFSDQVKTETGFTTDKSELLRALENIEAGGRTDILPPLQRAAAQLLEDEREPGLIIMLTDSSGEAVAGSEQTDYGSMEKTGSSEQTDYGSMEKTGGSEQTDYGSAETGGSEQSDYDSAETGEISNMFEGKEIKLIITDPGDEEYSETDFSAENDKNKYFLELVEEVVTGFKIYRLKTIYIVLITGAAVLSVLVYLRTSRKRKVLPNAGYMKKADILSYLGSESSRKPKT